MATPKVNSAGQKELEKVEEQFQRFDDQVKSLSADTAMKTDAVESEPQTKMSNREANRADAVYLKPERTIGSREKFNETFRDKWNHAKQYVRCIAENHEIIGETIEVWSKPFPGVNAEFWKVPTNKAIMMPRYLAEQLASRFYHRFIMDESIKTSADGNSQFYGAMAIKETRRRLDCRPVSSTSSVSMFG